jgi:hypothetical protein
LRFLIGIAGGYIGGSQWLNGFGGNRYTDSLGRGGWPGRCFAPAKLEALVMLPAQSRARAPPVCRE